MTDYLHLTVPKDSELAEEIRSIDAYNDAERLKQWADKQVKEDVKQDLKEYVDEELEDKIESKILQNVVDDALV